MDGGAPFPQSIFSNKMCVRIQLLTIKLTRRSVLIVPARPIENQAQRTKYTWNMQHAQHEERPRGAQPI
jgi:hypothetical protein